MPTSESSLVHHSVVFCGLSSFSSALVVLLEWMEEGILQSKGIICSLWVSIYCKICSSSVANVDLIMVLTPKQQQ